MQVYTEEFLNKCCETLHEAEEIKANKDLMKELEVKLKEKGQKYLDMAGPEGSLKKQFQAKLNESYKKEDEEKSKVKGERANVDEEPKLGSKA